MVVLKVLISLCLIASSCCASCQCKIKKQSECANNEIFLTHNPYQCQTTCAMYGVSESCKENYAPDGDCYCKPEFARYYDCGPCIPLWSTVCQKLGENVIPSEKLCAERQNEQFSASGGRGCRDTCIDYDTKECMLTTMPVPAPYVPVCECKEDYARLPTGECVEASSSECYEFYKPTPERCAKLGKLYSPFGSACQQGCDDYDPKSNLCLQSHQQIANKMILREACYCPLGKVVDNLGRCNPVESCPVKPKVI
ncbi:hypothetical protein HA402_006415 [Bradysia odoriphaga]|nr:hypothetical protein HA402_006415 [Bradysia odoriphaga]